MRRLATMGSALIALAVTFAPARAGLKITSGAAGGLKYLLYLPADCARHPEVKRPTILFLHGAAESGGDLSVLRAVGPPKHAEATPDFAFIVIAPQCTHNWWIETLRPLADLLDQLSREYPVDTDRLYLTGFSMGGYGTWYMAAAYPERFAAIAPVCGGGEPSRAALLKDLPIWVFHGAQDTVVPLSESNDMVKALQACGGNVRITIYPDLRHDCWTRTYDNPELYQWFLEHVRRARLSAKT